MYVLFTKCRVNKYVTTLFNSILLVLNLKVYLISKGEREKEKKREKKLFSCMWHFCGVFGIYNEGVGWGNTALIE
jgi:hypothetical protein